LVFLEERLEMRSLRIAEWSPTGAEMEDHDLALQIQEVELLAIERREGERGRRVADPGLRDLREPGNRHRKPDREEEDPETDPAFHKVTPTSLYGFCVALIQ